MQHGRAFAGMALAMALMFPLVGCATTGSGKARVSMSKMCQAHGGVWSQAGETCGMTGAGASQAARQAKDICADQGGTYLPGGTCELPGL
jgi:hypothetical protein